jgi:hypothetical protein
MEYCHNATHAWFMIMERSRYFEIGPIQLFLHLTYSFTTKEKINIVGGSVAFECVDHFH